MAKETSNPNYAAKLKTAILNAAITGKLTGGTNGWKTVKLGEIGKWKAGATPLRGNASYYEGGTVPWLKTGDLNDGIVIEVPECITQKAVAETSVVLNPIGTVLIAMYGATIGKVGILGVAATTNQACCACQVNETFVFNKYLFYFLLSRRESFKKAGMGGAQPNISKEKIVNTQIPLPPLSVQKEIVKKVEGLLKLIDVVQDGEKTLAELGSKARAKILDLAIHGKLVPQDPNDEPIAISSTSDKPPYQIPPNWRWVRLGDVADVVRGSGIKRNETTEFGVQCIRYGEIYTTYGYSFKKTTSFVANATADKCSEAHYGDVLCTLTGETEEDIAKATAYLGNERLVIGGDLAKITNHPFDPILLVYFMFSPFMVNQKASNSKGGMIVHIGKTALESLLIPLPPLAEQKRIVAKVEELLHSVDILTT